MKNFLLLIFLSTATLVHAQSFSKHNILGVWEVSSKKLNGFTSFGKEFSRDRGEVYTLIFNRSGHVKNRTTGTIYNYEIIKGQLKIYQTKVYKNNYTIKDKRHYDLWAMAGSFENCNIAKIVKKKIPGYYRKDGYKWCKTENFPQPTVTSSENYKF